MGPIFGAVPFLVLSHYSQRKVTAAATGASRAHVPRTSQEVRLISAGRKAPCMISVSGAVGRTRANAASGAGITDNRMITPPISINTRYSALQTARFNIPGRVPASSSPIPPNANVASSAARMAVPQPQAGFQPSANAAGMMKLDCHYRQKFRENPARSSKWRCAESFENAIVALKSGSNPQTHESARHHSECEH